MRFAQTRLVHDFFTSQLSKALDLAKPAAENKQVERVLNCSREQVTHISEPYPVFSQDLLRYSASDASWTILNSRYVLIFMQHHPYVVDVIALYQKWLLVQLHQVGLPLAQRPLLVPVSFPLSQSLKKITFELQGILARLGLQVEFSNEKTILIRSVPIQLPYLDIRLFLDSIVALNTLDADKLLELLSVCQSFDPRLLSSEERMELNQLLLSSENLKLFCKVLTEDDCRMLFHA